MSEDRKLARRLMYAIYGADEVFILKDRGMHINYAELSIMYVLDGDTPCSQKEIAEQMFIPLTTVNTIFAHKEAEQLIQLLNAGKKREYLYRHQLRVNVGRCRLRLPIRGKSTRNSI